MAPRQLSKLENFNEPNSRSLVCEQESLEIIPGLADQENKEGDQVPDSEIWTCVCRGSESELVGLR